MAFKLSNKWLCALFLLVVGVLLWAFNCFTPLFCDDWHYVFKFGTSDPVTSVKDIIVSQWHHYFGFNGRYIVHFFVQLFDGLLGKGVFNVANALVFVLFLYLLALNTSRDRSSYYKIMSVAFLLVFLLMTGFKYTILWLSGAFNYLWVGALLLLFNYLLDKNDLPKWTHLPLFVLGVFCGWSNEALAIGLGGAYFLYFAFHRKRLARHRVFMLAGFFLGMLFLVFSPAAINRALTASARTFSLMDRLVNMQNLRLFFVLILLLCLMLAFRKLKFKEWVRKEQVFIMATLISFAFIIFTGFFYSHSRYGIEMFSLVLILRMIDWERVGRLYVTVANVLVLAFAVYAVTVSARCYKVAQEELAHVAAGDAVIPTTDYISTSSYLRRFVLDYQGLGMKDGIDEIKYYGDDDWVPNYYGFENRFVCFLPKVFIDDTRRNPEAYQQFHTTKDVPFYAMRLNPGQTGWQAEFIYKPSKTDSYPWPLNRLLAKVKDEVGNEVLPVQYVTVNGERYVLVLKKRPSQDNRIEEIKLIDYPEWSKPAVISEPKEFWSHFL